MIEAAAAGQARAKSRAEAARLAREVGATLAAIDPERLGDLEAVAGAARLLTGQDGGREKLSRAVALDAANPAIAPAMRRLDALVTALELRGRRFAALEELEDTLRAGKAGLEAARWRAAEIAPGRDEKDDDAVAKLFEEAAAAFQRALQLDPESRDAGAGLVAATIENAAEALQGKRFEIARRVARQAAPLAPTAVAAFMDRVVEAERRETAFARDFARAKRARIEGDLRTALAGFRSALDIAPERRDVQVGLRLAEAGLACAGGRHEEELALIREAEGLAEGLPPADVEDVARESKRCRDEIAVDAFLKAEAAARARRHDEAAALLDRVLALRPGDEEARRLRSEVEATRKLPRGMILVPEGPFPYGPREASKDVRVAAFFIGATEITNAEFAPFVEQGGYAAGEYWDPEALPLRSRFVDRTGLPGPMGFGEGRPVPATEQFPVTGVSWYEAQAYARFRGMRLPTEVEWEKAATWNADASCKVYCPWSEGESDAVKVTRDLWKPYFARPGPKTAGSPAVEIEGRRLDDISPCKAFDMHGNVHEWTADRIEDLSAVRGGSFASHFEERARATRRFLARPDFRSVTLGFRLAAEAPK